MHTYIRTVLLRQKAEDLYIYRCIACRYGVAAEIEKGRGQPVMIWCFGLDIVEAE
jgi:hypothetical protein